MKSIIEYPANKARLSHPARGAWIEICLIGAAWMGDGVAPRKGCVD